MMHFTTGVVQLILIIYINRVTGFNLDVNNYIRHEGQNGSMFGFSVALHQESQRSWVIVGAPKTDTSQYQRGIIEGGAVFRCDISDDNRCQIIHFDSSNGNNVNEKNEQIDTKSHQWFGMTVSSAGIDGPLVACAPRYVYHQHQPKKYERIEPVGTCFIAKDNFREYQEYSPCRTMHWGYHRQGSCQAGLSAAVSKDGTRLYVGAPGSWYWQGQVYSASLNNPRDKVFSTKESTSKEDDSYLGYSTTTGDFTGDGKTGVAVGMPRGGDLRGKVLIYYWNMTSQDNITGEQIGAYFGYSLCVVDVDGDQLDDLIIGAPMYTEPNNEGKFENGRVYIVYQTKSPINDKFKELETREGPTSRGRFGLSLASLGDINLDGFGDFAVGAPYDGKAGRGAVYIYHGSRNGPLPKPSQVIYAEDVLGTDHLSTFGFSISGGIDLDGNQYPDMVVGAYESNNAIVFKSRAVAVMEATTSFDAENKLIQLESKNCTVGRDKRKVACTTLVSCLKYNGINLPTSIDLEISWILDSKKTKTPRMFFINDENKNIRNSTMRLYRGKSECKTEAVYIADGIRDKLTSLEVEMKYSIRQASTAYTTSTVSRRKRSTLDPVLDENRGTVQRDTINIAKNCGKDNICIPDLRLDVKTSDSYLLGANESLIVEVYISNNGEDAFESNFFMTIPKGLNYKSTKQIGESLDTSYTCTAPSYQTNNTLKCDLGNPLPAGKTVNFKVIMEPTKRGGKKSIEPFYDFYMEVNSTNEEADGGQFDNSLRKTVAIFVESDLSISGGSNPAEFHYNVSLFKNYLNSSTLEAEIGPQIVHIYDVRNNGTTTIEEIVVFIQWPARTLEGDDLMYLLNQPETLGPVQCDPSPYVNHASLQLDRGLKTKSYLDRNRVLTDNPQRNNIPDGSVDYETMDASNSAQKWNNQKLSGHQSSINRSYKFDSRDSKFNEKSNEDIEGSFKENYGTHRKNQINMAHRTFEEENRNDNSRYNKVSSASNSGHTREYEYREKFNTSSADGDFKEANAETSWSHGSAGHVIVDTSTDNVKLGGISKWGVIRESSTIRSNFEDKFSTISQSQIEYEKQQQEYYETQRRIQEEERIRLADERRRLQEHHRRAEEEKIRVEEEKRSREEERRRFDSNYHYRSSGLDSSNINQGQNSQSSSRSTQASSARSKIEASSSGYESNVDQDISNLAARTHAEQTSVHSGRRRMQSQQDAEASERNIGSATTSFEKAVQGGNGFRTVGLDLGVINNSNEQKMKSNHDASSFNTQNYHSGSSTGHQQHYSGHKEITRPLSEEDYESDYDESEDRNEHGGQSSSYSRTSSYSTYKQPINAQHANVDQMFKHYPKSKRDTSDVIQLPICKSTECEYVRCVVGPLDKNNGALIALRTRLVAHTLNKLGGEKEVKLSTMATGSITKLPYIGKPINDSQKTYEIYVTATPDPAPKSEIVPLWIWVLAACAGALILLLLIYLLYKCGFFKRNRPHGSPNERQPLNRNGNYHGDEHL